MMDILKKLNAPQSTARVVEGKLVLSLPNALRPTVWQMDVLKYAASALEVDDKDGAFTLVLKSTEEERVEIAAFTTREEAVQSLIAVSKALEKGSLISGRSAPSSTGGFNWKKLVTPALAVFFLFVLLNVWAALTPVEPTSLRTTAGVGSAAVTENGVPMSADAFLQQ